MPKVLWLKKYKPSVLTPPDEFAQAIFDTGNIVSTLAYRLFPDGKDKNYLIKEVTKKPNRIQQFITLLFKKL